LRTKAGAPPPGVLCGPSAQVIDGGHGAEAPHQFIHADDG
jgi:hypothetical protein